MNIFKDIAYRIFGNRVRRNLSNYHQLEMQLSGARIPKTVCHYVSIAYLYSLIIGFILAPFGIVVGMGLFADVQLSTISDSSLGPYFPQSISVVMGIIFALAGMLFFYSVYIRLPTLEANIRRTYIDQSLTHGSAYLYALSRGGGISLIEMFRSLSMHRHIYGATAEEFGYIVRDMEYFGYDLLTALRNASISSPSEKFKSFIDGLISVLSSGGDISAYMHSKMEQYQVEAARGQKYFLETLGILAEVYLTVFVVGPLFLIVILVVLGFIGSNSTTILYMMIYLLIPIGTAIFIVLLSTVSGDVQNKNVVMMERRLDVFDDVVVMPECKEDRKLLEKLVHYERLNRFKRKLFHPIKWFSDKPHYSFFATIPIGSIYLVYSIWDNVEFDMINSFSIDLFELQNMNIEFVSVLDDYLFFSLLMIFTPFIIFYEIRADRIRRIEDEMPDFLKRLASINEAGILLTDAISMVAQAKVGVLHSEVRRMSNDLSWGTNLGDVLKKFEYHIRTDMISRLITLIIKASESISDVISVLNIAASEADVQNQLKKERSAEMLVYVFIIYISYMVFLFIIYVLAANFLPAMPSSVGDVGAGMPISLDMDIDRYMLLFFHASMIQGFCSGLVAGKMGSGRLQGGIKHSIIMMSVAYLVFMLFI